MTVKAVLCNTSPSQDESFPIGSTVTLRSEAIVTDWDPEWTGDLIVACIYVNEGKFERKRARVSENGDCSSPQAIAEKDFVMPTSEVTVKFTAAHLITDAEGWRVDDEKTIKLTPTPPELSLVFSELPILSASIRSKYPLPLCSLESLLPLSASVSLPPAIALSKITLKTIPTLSASASVPPTITLSEITLETIPSMSASITSLTFSLASLTIETIPSLSASASLGIVITLPAYTLDPIPSLSPFLRLLVHPSSPLASAIIAQNQENLAEAFIERTADFKIAGWTVPPFVCFICGLILYGEGDFITHMTKHLTAYEEGGE